MQASRKSFTIERRRLEAAEASEEPSARMNPPDLDDVLERIEELRASLAPQQAFIANIAEAYRKEVEEAMQLRREMERIQTAIAQTRREVVAFHAGDARCVKVNHAAGELGAVVLDTEGATNTILGAAERIEMLAGVVQSETTIEGMKARAGEIANVVLSIYEACNFQDLTGQRIARVCETLDFVERRVARMTEIWGGMDELATVMAQEIAALDHEREALGTHALAAGPALVGADGHVDQDAIDALFD